ncbi:hypothetical protein MAR_028703 [Mya arenaria]|uniref:Uncharacterized protein n=1 Tax=Mya arenaria TaxID=6604 RepID=A0ABY7DIW0_MYAAR|nr:hypothetical protein MAR_028703 [Mya arenaria]
MQCLTNSDLSPTSPQVGNGIAFSRFVDDDITEGHTNFVPTWYLSLSCCVSIILRICGIECIHLTLPYYPTCDDKVLNIVTDNAVVAHKS